MFAALMLQWYTMLPQFVYTIFCFQYPVASEKKRQRREKSSENTHWLLCTSILTTIECWLLHCVCVCRLHIILNIFYCIQIKWPSSKW